ncbi:hypothetical protein CRENBAI_016484 [Crenichthys baileyi]|uniref:Uncharacterized protein n=1 Tax=Crenichthys baileyi TaxID=28760 RepID=A0AAV9SBG9_9TELE
MGTFYHYSVLRLKPRRHHRSIGHHTAPTAIMAQRVEGADPGPVPGAGPTLDLVHTARPRIVQMVSGPEADHVPTPTTTVAPRTEEREAPAGPDHLSTVDALRGLDLGLHTTTSRPPLSVAHIQGAMRDSPPPGGEMRNGSHRGGAVRERRRQDLNKGGDCPQRVQFFEETLERMQLLSLLRPPVLLLSTCSLFQPPLMSALQSPAAPTEKPLGRSCGACCADSSSIQISTLDP